MEYEVELPPQLYGLTHRVTKGGREILLECPKEDCDSLGKLKLSYNPVKDQFQCFVCEFRGPGKALWAALGIDSAFEAPSTAVQGLIAWPPGPGAGPAQNTGKLTSIFDLAGVFPLANSPQLVEWLQSRNVPITEERINKLGYAYSGPWAFRVLFPCMEQGKLVYFVARAIHPEVSPKYKNPYTDQCIRRREDVLYFESEIPYTERVIVEGIIDAMVVGGSAIATLGKSVTETQLWRLLELKECRTFSIALDFDGRKQALKLAQHLLNHGRRVRLVEFPPKQDPSSLGYARWEEFHQKARELNRMTVELELAKLGKR